MLFQIYYNSIKTISILLFYTLIALLISILVINNKLLDSVNNMNEQKFKENLKTQKGLIWANYSIIIIFFVCLLLVSFNLFSRNFQEVHNRRKGIIIRNILLFCMIVITTGLTYYINNILNNINILDAKNDLIKIYIIVPITSILTLGLLMDNFSNTDQILTFMNNYFLEHQFDLPSVTKKYSPSFSYSNLDEINSY